METVNNLTAAASRAVFGTGTTNTAGESAGQEPVSGGALGDVKKGEPYDMGNIEAETGEGTEPVAGEKGDVKKGEPFDLGNAGEFLRLVVARDDFRWGLIKRD